MNIYENEGEHKVLISDEIFGKVRNLCNSNYKILWKAYGTYPTGTLKIINTSKNCSILINILRKTNYSPIEITIPPDEELVLTITFIESILAKYVGGDHDLCTGFFCLIIHFPWKDRISDCQKPTHPITIPPEFAIALGKIRAVIFTGWVKDDIIARMLQIKKLLNNGCLLESLVVLSTVIDNIQADMHINDTCRLNLVLQDLLNLKQVLEKFIC